MHRNTPIYIGTHQLISRHTHLHRDILICIRTYLLKFGHTIICIMTHILPLGYLYLHLGSGTFIWITSTCKRTHPHTLEHTDLHWDTPTSSGTPTGTSIPLHALAYTYLHQHIPTCISIQLLASAYTYMHLVKCTTREI